MTQQEKMEFIAGLLLVSPHELSPESELINFIHWDSLTMTNMQIEFSMYGSNITLEELRACQTIAELCDKLKN